jgi:hypothetical protein
MLHQTAAGLHRALLQAGDQLAIRSCFGQIIGNSEESDADMKMHTERKVGL